ncbi:SsgA family sporulation/cell division regulator [Streptomyces xantholiticus]
MTYENAVDNRCVGQVSWKVRVHHVRGRLRFPVDATFRYSSVDPLAVRITFRPLEGWPVTWRVARDLLATGTRVHAGTGDVRLGPAPGPGRDGQVHLRLGTSAQQALFTLDRAQLTRGLARTYELVPAGREADHFDWNTIDRLLENGRGPHGRR